MLVKLHRFPVEVLSVRFITLCQEPLYCKQGRENPFKTPTSCFLFRAKQDNYGVSVVTMGGKKTNLATWKTYEADDFMGLQILKVEI